MIHCTLSFISGITAQRFFPFFPLTITLLCIFIFTFLLIKKKTTRKRQIIFMLIFLSGFVYSSVREPDTDSPVTGFYEKYSYITGKIVDVPETYKGKIRITLDDVYINTKKFSDKVRLFLPLDGSYDRNLRNPLKAGDRISAIADVRETLLHQNPGVFPHDVKKDGIHAIGFIHQFHVFGREKGFLTWTSRLRQRLGEITDRSLSAENASFLKAIIPGLKKGIRPEMRDAFSGTGLAHLLSISGTHFGLLAFIVFGTVKGLVKLLPFRLLNRMTLFFTPTQVAVIFTLPVLVSYACISGASTPTVRSLVMVCIYMSALLLGRKGEWLNSLSIAAFLILMYQPGYLFDISFQLSFTAVLFIGLSLESPPDSSWVHTNPFDIRERNDAGMDKTMPRVNALLAAAGSRVKTTILITTAAVFGTAPFVILYFKQFPVISFLSNLLVTPFICLFILPLGFLSSSIALMLNMSFLPFSSLLDTTMHWSLSLIDALSKVPYANVHTHNPHPSLVGMYFVVLFFLMKTRKKWACIPLSLVMCLYVTTPSLFVNNTLSITFLDVGQGDATVIEFPDNKILLIDGGMHEPDMGRMVIAPHLWSRGIKKIDYLAVSHNHPDHYGGLLYIMDTFRIGELWLNGRPDYGHEDLHQKLLKNGIPVRVLRRGDMFEGKTYRIAVLHPYDEFSARSSRGYFSNENNDSLVIKIDTGKASVLFTGDIENEAEENLLHLAPWLRSDILKVPHHGGRTSSSPAFLEAVNPSIAVASAGRYNSFHHPHTDTVGRYTARGIKMYRTDRDGAVTIIPTNNSSFPYEVITHRDRTLKPVQALSDELKNLALLFW